MADNFAQAAAETKDHMVQNMGFERRLETASFIIPQQSLPLTGGEAQPPPAQVVLPHASYA